MTEDDRKGRVHRREAATMTMRSLLAVLALAALTAAPARASTKAAYQHYMRALLLEQQRNFPQALQEYRTAIALDPQSGYLHEAAAKLALETGQLDAALEFAQKVVTLEPQSHKARFLLGSVLWARAETEKSREAFEEALKLQPRFTEALLALGNLLASESPERAKAYFERYLAANPENAAEAHYQIALLEQKEGRLDKAAERLRRALESDGDNAQIRYALAQVYETQRDTEAALGEYGEILAREPHNLALLGHVGEIRFMRGENERAAELFQRAKAIQPDNPGACLWLAILAESKGDFDAAVAELKDSAGLKEEAALNLRLSYYLTQAGRVKEAVAALEEAHKRWPANGEVSYFLALGYDDLRLPDKAIALLKEVVKDRPDFRDARFQLGALYEKAGRIDDAEREFREIIAQRPTDASALNYLGYSLADRGLKLDDAEALVRRAVEVDPSNGAYRDSLGWVHHKRGRTAEALAELGRAVEREPADATIWGHLGDAYAVAGDSVAAWRAWKKAERFDAQGTEPAKRLAALDAALGPERVGDLTLAVLKSNLGALASYGGFCELKATVLGKEFSSMAILAFKAPGRLSLDLLGPLFVPVMHASLSKDDSFEMDPLQVEGLSPEAARDTVYLALRAVRDFLLRRPFEGPARWSKGWRTQYLSVPAGQLFLNDRRQAVKTFQPAEEGAPRLSFDDFRDMEGRLVPAFLKLEGKGFSFSFRLNQPAAAFEDEAKGR